MNAINHRCRKPDAKPAAKPAAAPVPVKSGPASVSKGVTPLPAQGAAFTQGTTSPNVVPRAVAKSINAPAPQIDQHLSNPPPAHQKAGIPTHYNQTPRDLGHALPSQSYLLATHPPTQRREIAVDHYEQSNAPLSSDVLDGDEEVAVLQTTEYWVEDGEAVVESEFVNSEDAEATYIQYTETEYEVDQNGDVAEEPDYDMQDHQEGATAEEEIAEDPVVDATETIIVSEDYGGEEETQQDGEEEPVQYDEQETWQDPNARDEDGLEQAVIDLAVLEEHESAAPVDHEGAESADYAEGQNMEYGGEDEDGLEQAVIDLAVLEEHESAAPIDHEVTNYSELQNEENGRGNEGFVAQEVDVDFPPTENDEQEADQQENQDALDATNELGEDHADADRGQAEFEDTPAEAAVADDEEEGNEHAQNNEENRDDNEQEASEAGGDENEYGDGNDGQNAPQANDTDDEE